MGQFTDRWQKLAVFDVDTQWNQERKLRGVDGSNSKTYRDGVLFPYPRRYEAKHHPADRDAYPKPSGDHSGVEGLSGPFSDHEDHEPATKRDLNAYIAEEENSSYPTNA